MKKEPILKIKNLKKQLAGKWILRGVNLDLFSGSSLSIIGHSGCGKSVLMKCICGLMIPNSGSSIIFKDSDITFTPFINRTEFKTDFGFSFQGDALFDSMNIWQNVAFSKLALHSHDELKNIVAKKLEIVDLKKDVMYKMPHELSGGMRKRVGIARALFKNPQILFLDEPTSGLDPINGRRVANLIDKLRREYNITVLTITHDSHYIDAVSTHVSVLEKGRISWSGSKEQATSSNQDFLESFSF